MARLLMIHTGGTIAMVPAETGFAPKPGVAEALARDIMRSDLPDVALAIHSFDPLIDSADINPGHWNDLIGLIAEAQRSYDGIVLTHGTDTLAYTAAALLYALEDLACPVVVTGAMRPTSRTGSDARDNLRSALSDALTGSPGVRVRFAGRSMSGDRVVKVSSISLDAFREIPLAPAQGSALPDRRPASGRFADKRVAVLALSPGLTAEVLDAALAPLDGAVLRCYGSGTIPSDPAFRSVLSSRIARGLTVVAISQCEQGGVRPGEYAASSALREAGVLDGGSLTTEAALAKLALTLSAPPATATRSKRA